jgi:hypothetical protein
MLKLFFSVKKVKPISLNLVISTDVETGDSGENTTEHLSPSAESKMRPAAIGLPF